MHSVVVKIDDDTNKIVCMYQLDRGHRTKGEAINEILVTLAPHIKRLTK